MIQIKRHTIPWGRHEKDKTQTLEFDLGTDIQDAFRVAKLLAELNDSRVIFKFNGFFVDTDRYDDVETLMAAYRRPTENQTGP